MSHAWRPVAVVFGVILCMMFFRMLFKPSDFKAANGDYKYQYHRVKSEDDWKSFKVKHMGTEFCAECHPDKIEIVKGSGHSTVKCENCHAMFEPSKKGHEKVDLKATKQYLLDIGIDRSRELCKRCHAKISYRPQVVKMIDPNTHNQGIECVNCHDVHRTSFK
ncbi:MAG: cytochrome c family protein [Candidatus Magnetoovum sp. WYHC-5]|nr:cytochrome c family protein [Candidatus Magnetoovum sp. WYHC-5]